MLRLVPEIDWTPFPANDFKKQKNIFTTGVGPVLSF